MKIINSRDFSSEYLSIFNNIIDNKASYKLKHNNKKIILLPEEEYDNLLETVDLLHNPTFKKRLAIAEKKIENRETFSTKEVRLLFNTANQKKPNSLQN